MRRPVLIRLCLVAVMACASVSTAAVILTRGGTAVAASAAVTARLAADFNDGKLPENWSVSTAGSEGSVIVDELPDAVDRSLRVTKTATAGEVFAAAAFGPLTGTVQVGARVRVAQTTGFSNVLYVAGSTAPVASVAVNAGQLFLSGPGTRVMPVEANHWYALRLVLRTGTQRFDLYVDGRKVVPDAPFRAASTDVARVTVGFGNGYTGILHVDTVFARRVPDPSVDYAVLDQFNDVSVNAQPPGYTVTSSAGSATVVATPSDADRSLLLKKDSTANEVVANRYFGALTGTAVLQANVRTDDTEAVKAALYTYSSTGMRAACVQFDYGYLTVFDGTTRHRILAVTAEEWYTVRLVLDFEAQRFEVFIDGRRYTPSTFERDQVAPRWSFRDEAVPDLGRLMSTIGPAQSGTLYLDNVMAYRASAITPPGTIVNVRDYGAVGDGVTDDTDAVQRAVDDVPNGGSVVLSGGVFLTGTIQLKSDMTLWVNRDAVLLGTWDMTRYIRFGDGADPATPNMWGIKHYALLLSTGADRLRIDGGGTIDGHGENPAWNKDVPEADRPALLYLTRGKDISLRNVAIKDAGHWATVLAEDEGVLLADLNIDTVILGNRDAIDLVDVHDTLVERVNTTSNDDAICFKSYSTVGVDTATVRLSTVGRNSANGVKFGSASRGGFRHVDVEDVLVKHTGEYPDQFAAITITAVDGAAVGDVHYRRITVDDALRVFFVLLARRPIDVTPKWISGVEFSDIAATRIADTSLISGQKISTATFLVYDVTLYRVTQKKPYGVTENPGYPPEYPEVNTYYPESSIWKFRLPATGFFFRHVRGVTVQDSPVTAPTVDPRPAVFYDDAP